MKFETVSLFDKQFKKLAKKYNLIKNDVEEFMQDFDTLHLHATSIYMNTSDFNTYNRNSK